MMKKIKKEDIDCAINCLHKSLIVKAEMSAFDECDRDTIGSHFNKAIVMSGRSGFSQDEALANELLASYLMSIARGRLLSEFEIYEERKLRAILKWSPVFIVDFLVRTLHFTPTFICDRCGRGVSCTSIKTHCDRPFYTIVTLSLLQYSRLLTPSTKKVAMCSDTIFSVDSKYTTRFNLERVYYFLTLV